MLTDSLLVLNSERTTATFCIALTNDGIPESGEHLVLSLSVHGPPSSRVVLDPDSAMVTILDDVIGMS